MTRPRATLIGFTAVLMWALLALFTIGSAPVPPFQLSAICFGIGGVIGLVWTARGIGLGALRKISWKVYAFGTLGLFGYHFFYFTAFRWGPTAATGLIAYLWPLFIVLFSGLLPGERLRKGHVIGAFIALLGAGLIVVASRGDGGANSLPALALAFLCALTWSSYSVLSRRLGAVPTESVTIYCLATAALSLLAHLTLETTQWPATPLGWGAVLALGIGPVGAAFFTWDIGMKKGDIQLLGVASYAAPLLSTLVLVAAGIAQPTASLAVATVLITAGAALAARASAGRQAIVPDA
ncbi:DMT family transporter [Pseudorhodobacter sp. E13]|uniref:aromatic amino acid exporter YddG n=1 Tax=Pseudorhodobacter sp. E13 TaxID=2487931 RepID=UPI000F8F1B7E|nr:DMT family transporter [Pseudorhodobacter sp. E13]RUS58776.1 DMT family transporter [Pseudorhodobacter sp. E13]